jgi:hypothetical protein
VFPWKNWRQKQKENYGLCSRGKMTVFSKFFTFWGRKCFFYTDKSAPKVLSHFLLGHGTVADQNGL